LGCHPSQGSTILVWTTPQTKLVPRLAIKLIVRDINHLVKGL
jgi:hypothetical protein